MNDVKAFEPDERYDFDFIYKFTELESRSYTKDTLVSMKNSQYTVIAENIQSQSKSKSKSKASSKTEKNSLKIYRKTYISSENQMEFRCVRTRTLDGPVCKLALNQECDILVVNFADGRVRLFFIEEKRQNLSNAKFATSVDFEEIKTVIKPDDVYAPSALCMAQLDLFQISKKLFKINNQYVYVEKNCPSSKKKPECLVLYNRVQMSLEIYSIADPDDVFLAVEFRIANLCRVSTIGYLEKDWLVLGGRSHGSILHEFNLVLFDPHNFRFYPNGWKELADVREVVYHRDSQMLFVAAEKKYFAVFTFNLKSYRLSKYKFYSPDLKYSGKLSFLLENGSKLGEKMSAQSLLLITNGSNRFFSYKIQAKSR